MGKAAEGAEQNLPYLVVIQKYDSHEFGKIIPKSDDNNEESEIDSPAVVHDESRSSKPATAGAAKK